MVKKILIETYGCTLNQADSDIMHGILENHAVGVERRRYEPETDSSYDFVIVNTCTVKKATEQKITERLKFLNHLGPKLIVTGCMASANPDIIERTAPAASILSTGNTTKIYDAISHIAEYGREDRIGHTRLDKSPNIRSSGSIIARIPISEGCLSACSFCETKFARGPLNSFSEKLILKAIELNVRKGSKEIELTSQDIGAYGADSGTDIAELVNKAVEIDGNFMIRIGMLNPEHIHKYLDRLLEAYNSEKVYKFIHLPVQSGSDRVLSEMERRYSVEEFTSCISEIRRRIPDMCIATDVIVGYPTETWEDFEETESLLRRLGITITNISKYGSRPHAKASILSQHAGPVMKERSLHISRMVREMQHAAFSSYVGMKIPVLITESGGKSITGRTTSYIPVAVTDAEESDMGNRIDVKITGNSYACIIGRKSE